MSLDTIAALLADATFHPKSKRNIITWVSVPDTLSITGKLKGIGKTGIVTVHRTGNGYTLGVKGPRNISLDTILQESTATAETITRFGTDALTDITGLVRRPSRVVRLVKR